MNAGPTPRSRSIVFLGYLALIIAMMAVPRMASAGKFGTQVTTYNYAGNRLAVDPIRARVYASVTGDNEVVVFNTNPLGFEKVIHVGVAPIGMAFSQDGNTLYVANSGNTVRGISVIDLNTLTVVSNIPTPDKPYEIAIGLAGRMYITANVDLGADAAGNIEQIDSAGTLQQTLPYPYSASLLQISPDRKTLYMGDEDLSPASLQSVDVSGTSFGTVIEASDLAVGEDGDDMELSHSGAFLCYGVNGSPSADGVPKLSAADISTVYGYFDMGEDPTTLTFSPDDAYVYSVPGFQNAILAFNSSTYMQTGTAAFATGNTLEAAKRAAVDYTGRYLFVTATDGFGSAAGSYIGVYTTGRIADSVTSASRAYYELGKPFSYQITATNDPTSYNLIGYPSIPDSISLNSATGLISGTWDTTGTTTLIVSGSSAASYATRYVTAVPNPGLFVSVSGSGAVTNTLLGLTDHKVGSTVNITATPAKGFVFVGWSGDITSTSNPLSFTYQQPTQLTAIFSPPPPVVASGQATVLEYADFSYPISATNQPTSYNATGLPAGLNIDTSTGLITGQPSVAGTFGILLSASNAAGVGSATLVLSINVTLSITVVGPGTVTGQPSFSDHRPGDFISLTAVPDYGYVFFQWEGIVNSSSNPTGFTIENSTSINAYFVPGPGAVTSGTLSPAEYGQPYTNEIDTNITIGIITYSTSTLPAGLSLAPSTGIITGTPTVAGDFLVLLSATTSGASITPRTVDIDIAAELNVLTSSTSAGTVTPSGITYGGTGTTVDLVATPKAGFAFARWTNQSPALLPPSYLDPFPFILNESDNQWIAEFVPWSNLAYTYIGLLPGTDTQGTNTGKLTVVATKLGSFTGTLVINGITYHFTGKFSGTNTATVTIPRGKLSPITIDLSLSTATGFPAVTGSLGISGSTETAVAAQHPAYSGTNRTSLAGLYTVTLSSTAVTSGTAPAGTGYADITVTTLGAATVAGMLPDGTPFTSAGALSVATSSTSIAVYAPLYAKAGAILGSISGNLTFGSGPGITGSGTLQGSLNWSKPNAFTADVAATGALYKPALRLTGTGGTITVTGTDAGSTFAQTFTISATHQVIINQPNPHNLTFALVQGRGLFSGQFLDATHIRHYHGIILQPEAAGAGYFEDAFGNGSISLSISP